MPGHYLRPTCSHCVFWTPDLTADPATIGHCHRFPPAVYVNTQTSTVVQKFPHTERHHWCGEWTDDEGPLQEAAKRSVMGAVASPVQE